MPINLSPFEGELSFDGPALAAAADDFGHLVSQVPLAVARPHTVADVVALTEWAADRGWEVAARGQGHSIYGRSQVAGGLVVDLGALDRIHDVHADRVDVDVDAGATWRSVLAETLTPGQGIFASR